MEVGARYLGGGRCRFAVWAPLLKNPDLVIVEPREGDYLTGKEER